ncbi:MAG: S1 RNA-binding domain-containing protein [Anaerolineae bacterium]|nr:S1 RNA-binding domain-containing protein [Anaerolineae bacterium]
MDQNDTPLEQGTEQEDVSNENTESVNNMESLLEKEGLGIDFPRQGEIRDGMIASITPGQILVSVGTKSEGVISGREYESIPAEELAALAVGQNVPVYVINPEDSSGTLVLSLTRARDEVNWQEVEALLTSKETIHTKIVGYNKGGLIALVKGIRGFIPASQIALGRRAGMTGDSPEQRYSSMVGDEISVSVIEVDRERRRLILSERAASTETRESVKDRLIEELNVGDVRSGRVTSLADFGAFVNINGADGLVHLSEISWDRITHPSELLKVGQEVKVKIIAVDREKRRIGLSIRQLQHDPWNERVAAIKVGQLVEATITRLAKFGAFARLAGMEDVEGLIHISEISEKRIEHPREALHEGENVTLRVIRIEPENHRIALSVRRVDSMQYADMDWQTLLEQQAESAAKEATTADAGKAEETKPVEALNEETTGTGNGEDEAADAKPEIGLGAASEELPAESADDPNAATPPISEEPAA